MLKNIINTLICLLIALSRLESPDTTGILDTGKIAINAYLCAADISLQKAC